LRDKPNERVQMLNRFTSTLNKLQRPYAVVQGQGEERFRSALQAIEQHLPYV
jgi:nicotinamide riboside kinase